jgi:hypothetical protein
VATPTVDFSRLEEVLIIGSTTGETGASEAPPAGAGR